MILTTIISIVPKFLLHICTLVVVHMTRALLIVSFVLSLLYHLGYIHRFMWFSAERELSKLLNDTPVTIGSLKVDLLRGRAWVTNLVLHSPQRHKWKWQSPVLARVGKLYVECNLVKCLFFEWFVWEMKPIDIYTLEVSDIQAFVERKHHVFNFYLLDPHVTVPDPPATTTSNDNDNNVDFSPINTTLTEDPTNVWQNSNNNNTNDSNTDKDPSSSEQDKAQRLVDDMVRALGKATTQGGLSGALIESRNQLKSKLKALQTTTKKSEAMSEGVKLVQQVSKSLVEKSSQVPQIVLPPRVSLPIDEKIIYGRIGRVIISDSRIFTRDHHFDSSNNSNKLGDNLSVDDDHDDDNDNREDSSAALFDDGGATNNKSSGNGGSSWNKPIYIEQVVVRSAELCPPLSAKDVNDSSLPAVYQPMDKYLEVIRTRVLTEVAKSNTGRLFQTAMGEVLEYWMEKDLKQQQQQQQQISVDPMNQ